MMRKTANRAFTVLTAAAVCSGAWAANITGIDTVDKLVELSKITRDTTITSIYRLGSTMLVVSACRNMTVMGMRATRVPI
jgi:hypothetical protein